MTLLYISLAYMMGVALGRLLWDAGVVGCDFPHWLWLAPLALAPFSPLLDRITSRHARRVPMRWPASAGFEPPRSGPSPAQVAALLLCLAAGALRYASHPLTPCWTPADLAYYNLPAARAFDRAAPQAEITGFVSSYPTVADTKQEMTVSAGTIRVDGRAQPVQGELRLKTGIRQHYAYGQPVRVRGRLTTPPDLEDFSYREYLARKNIHSLLYSPQIDVLDGPPQGSPLLRLLYMIRARGEAVINRALPEPYAALANGMLLGVEAGIPDDLYDQFNATGSSHVIVISGSNVALIAGVMMALSVRLLGKRRALWPTLGGIACYALLVGGDAAVLRASVMGSLAVVAASLNRSGTALVSLAAACGLMMLINPLALWDLGLQLSSTATAGLILLVPGLTQVFQRLVEPRDGAAPSRLRAAVNSLLEDAVIVTLAANIMTLPLIVYYFGRLSLVSQLTNLLILPVQPLIMFWGSAGVVIGVAGLEWLARPVLWIPWLALGWTVGVVQWTASLPFASLEIAGYTFGLMVATYGLIFAVRWRTPLDHVARRLFGWLRVDWLARLVGPALASALAITAALVWVAALTQPDRRLHVWFLDIGQGDGILIQTPSGRQVLIDGGASPQALFGELGAVMPFWDRSLDMVVLTHPDGDHMNAQVEVPARYRIASALHTAAGQANPDEQPWRDRMAAAHVQVNLQHAGGWVDLGDGVALWVVWPTAEGYTGENADNENSLVTRLVYGDFSVLLTGDGEFGAEAGMLASDAPLASTLLKVGHHGSKGSTSEAFLEAVNPVLAAVQVGKDNDYGHPHPDTLAKLAGRLVLRNDEQGRLHVASDGKLMWVETER